METITIAQPDATELSSQADAIVMAATDFVVQDAYSYTAALEAVRHIKTFRKKVMEWFKESKGLAFTLHRSITTREKETDAPAKEAEAIYKCKAGAWELAEQQRELEEQERLREQARKEEEEGRLAEAARLEGAGHSDQADALLEAPPANLPMPILPSAVPKIKGVSSTTVYRHRIVNASLIPRVWLIADEKRIAAFGRSMGEKAAIEGVEFYPEQRTAARAY